MLKRVVVYCLFAAMCFPSSASARQADASPREANKGTIQNGHIYTNSALGITMPLPGNWEFMEVDAYSSPEQKAKSKAEQERIRAHCSGPLCGDADVNEALQYKVNDHAMYSVFVLGYKLSAEYQNRRLHPLLEFARITTSSTTSHGWVVDENLAPIRVAERPVYRILMHNATFPQAKGFIYVADSNGFVFMLVATAMHQPDELQSAVESMKLVRVGQ
jgi:hypothetical protein